MPVLTSFLPAATQMIYDMELDSMLRGVTFECPTIAAEQPKVVRCVLEGKNYSSQEIDRIFSASKQEGRSLYYVDEPLLAAIAPDVIFTQDVCEVCQIDTECTARAVANLSKQPRLVALTPQSLEDVFHTAVVIAEAAGKEENAYRYLAGLNRRIDNITDQLRKFRASLKRVMLMEWMEPIYNCGHWIPHQIAYAGGVDMLSNPSGDSIVTRWEKILRYDPEILVIAPCGFSVQRSMEEMHLLTDRPEWQDLQAVKNNRVYIADFDLFTQPSANTLVQGIELLAGLFHPEIISIPENLRTRYASFSSAPISVHS